MVITRGTATAGTAGSASVGAGVAGASDGAAAGITPTTVVTGDGDRLITAAASAAPMLTAVGAGAAGVVVTATVIIPEPLSLTTGTWRSVPLPATG